MTSALLAFGGALVVLTLWLAARNRRITREVEQKARLDAQLQHTRRLEAIGQLAGGIAHDFNNVLQTIKGYTELAVEELPPDHPARGYLAHVGDAVNRAATFTTHLLMFSRRDAPRTEPLNVNTIVADTGELLRHAFAGLIDLKISTAAEMTVVNGDRGQIEQILMILSINARDAMPDGGVVTIETGRAQFAEADLRAKPWAHAGDFVFIRVVDEGTGIPADVRPHLFEPFFTTKPPGRASGLGLSTAYAIAERHGGMIAVDTTVDTGSTFTVYLPTTGAPAPETRAQAAAAATQGRGETILLAEDEPMVRELAIEMLEAARYRVIAAADGAEAEQIIAARASELSAAVLDVVMPGRNGRQVYETLMRQRPDVPVIFCSGYSFGELDDISQLPGSSVLTKPYNRTALLATLRKAIETRGELPTNPVGF